MAVAFGSRVKRVLRAVWDGPFSLGSLSRPASLGDVLAKIIEIVWKSVISVFGVLVVSVLAVVGYSLYLDATRPSAEDIVLTIRLNDVGCSSEFPVGIIAKNNSSHTVKSMNYSIYANEIGRSTNLVEYGYLSSDFIVGPGEVVAWCIAEPILKYSSRDSVIWSAVPSYVSFE